MSIRGTVGSFSESHRAKAKRPDQRNFIPQTGWLPQSRSIVPKASLSVPNGPPPVPIFLASLPRECPRSHWRQGRAQRSGGRPQFFCGFPHFTEGFSQFPGHVPQFFSSRTHLQWSVPQPFTRNCRKKSQKAQRQTLTRPSGHPLPSDGSNGI